MSPPDPAPSAPTSAAVPVVGATLLAVMLELGGGLARESLPDSPIGLIAWAVAVIGLIGGAMAFVAGLGGALGRLLRLDRALAPVSNRLGGTLGLLLGALFIAGAIAAWGLDLILYARLYPAYHAALGLATVFGALLGLACLARREGPMKPAPRWLWLASWLGCWLLAHLSLAAREDARAVVLGQGVLAADVAWAGRMLTDVDRDGVGWLFDMADAHPTDPERVLPERCLGVVPTPESGPSWAPAAPAEPLNVLMITVDALRMDHTPSHPEGGRFMPGTTRFGETATVFERAYAPASMTLPTMISVMTGRYPWATAWAPTVVDDRDGVRTTGPGMSWPRAWPGDPRVGTSALDRHPTLAEGLTAAGWTTAGFPPHESFLGPFGLGRGFERYSAAIVRDLNPNGVSVTGGASADRAMQFMLEQGGRPFFAWVHLFDPHHPYRYPPGTNTTDDSDLARYRAEILFTDLQVSRLLRALEVLKIADRTIVVFTSDHGEAFGEHGAGYHSTALYDELVRVPLIIRVPGQAPRRVADAVSLVDVAPTLGRALGLPPAPTWQGRDLGPAIAGRALPPAPVLGEVAYELNHRKYMLVDGPWKLIWDWTRNTRLLFETARDPGERYNLVEAEPERAAAMTEALCAALKATDGLAVPPAAHGQRVPLFGD